MERSLNSNVTNRKFVKFAWFVVGYNLLVIIWGAFVRASKSGDGCGVSYPLCNGMIVPHAAEIKTVVEFMHRVSTTPALIFVFILLFWAFRAFPQKHPARKYAVLSLIFILTEGAIGAALVLYRLVAHDDSIARAFSMSAHLVNTLILLAVLALTAFTAESGRRFKIKGNEILSAVFASALLGMFLVGVSGAIAALGDTLFPASSLADSMQQDFSETAHFLIRLRFLHPLLSVSVGSFAAILAAWHLWQRDSLMKVRRAAAAVIALVVIQIIAGAINVLLLAPIWMQLVHLLLADLLWLSLVLLAAKSLSYQKSESAVFSETATSALETANV